MVILSQKLILDADGDTSITADTDDQIDIKIAGDDDFTFTASTLTVNSTNKICFNDATQFIQGASGTVLDIAATDEIELNATAVDLNGTLDVSGNSQFSGTVTVGVDDTGKDVKLFGASSGSHLLWDESADDLNLIASGLGVTTAKDLGTGIHIRTADSGAGVDAGADELVLENSGNAGLSIASGTTSTGTIIFSDSGGSAEGFVQYKHDDNYLRFGTGGGNERMRILSDGKVGIGKISSIRGFDVHNGQANNYMSEFANTSDDRPHGLFIEFTAAAPNSNGPKFLLCADTSSTRFQVDSNGNVLNSANSYSGLSDTRLKENITDAKSQWEDVKKIKFKNFNLIKDSTTQLGVIAQDLETDGMKGLVSNSPADKHQIGINSEFGILEDDKDNPNEDGTFPKKIKENLADVKSVKYSVLLLKSAKALQEAMAKIETLETKVKALEDA